VLRRVENASVSFRPRLFSKKGIVDFMVGSRTAAIAMMTSEEFEGIQRQQLSYPARVATVMGGRTGSSRTASTGKTMG
jgi:hypothetical protein